MFVLKNTEISQSSSRIVNIYKCITTIHMQGRIQDFKFGGGAHLKILRRTEGGAKMFGVFRVKNHDFTQTNHIFSAPGAPPPFGSAPAHQN